MSICRTDVLPIVEGVESIVATPEGIWKISEVALAIMAVITHFKADLSKSLQLFIRPFRLIADNIVFLQLAKLGQEWATPDDKGVNMWNQDTPLVASTVFLTGAYLLSFFKLPK